MKLIHQNPFRIVGLLSNATLKETTKRKSKINAFLSVNQSIDSEFDFYFLEKIERKKSSVNKAFADIQQGKDKVNHSLFWFLNAKPYDNTAIEYLKKGAKEKALDIWNKITIDKEVNSNNFSAFNNLGTYKLLSKKKSDIKIGIEAKIKLIESEYFESFVHSVADETFTVDNQKQAEKLIDELLKQFKKQFRDLETLQLFDGCNTTTQKYLSAKFTEGPIHKIETQVEQSKKERKSDKDKTYAFGLKLFTNTKDDLSLLNSLLGENNLKYKSIADQLANEIMQCAIDYFNESQENGSDKNYLESAQKLTKLADSIAVGKLAKDRAKDSLATLADMKDREVNQATAILNSIKLAYETSIREIDAQVSAMRMTMSHNQSINYSKVDKMKTNCLNWDKVVEVISNGISTNDVKAIQRCSEQSKVAEYKSLVDFLLSKLGPIQINRLKYLCYWKDIRSTQATAITNKVGSTISSASEGCYIATLAYGDYDHPQVLELRKFRDNFLSKTVLGRKFIKVYYKYSPNLVERLKNKQGINHLIRKGLDLFIKTIR